MDQLINFCMNHGPKWRRVATPLKRLNSMIGMPSIKTAISRQVKFLIAIINSNEPTRSTRNTQTKHGTSLAEKRRKLFASKEGVEHRALPPVAKEDSDDESDEDESTDEEEDEEIDLEDGGINLLKLFATKSTSKRKREPEKTYRERSVSDLTDKELDVEYNRMLLGDHSLHLLLMGPPGVGKTTVASLLYNVWVELGLVMPKKFFLVTKADLIAGYLGRSVDKTRKLIASAQHGVICIDECYSLIASPDGTDQYGREVLTEIINAMTDPLNKAIFMFCGYKNKIESQLFTANEGLERRFGYIFNIEKPTPDDLFAIFEYQMKADKTRKWRLEKKDRETIRKFFHTNKDLFLRHCGGATEKLCRMCEEECILDQFPSAKSFVIKSSHVEKSLKTYQDESRKRENKTPPMGIYC